MPNSCAGTKASPMNDACALSRFVHYAQKRFQLPLLASGLTDGRSRPEIPIRSVILSLVLGEVAQVPSLLQLQAETRLPQWQRWCCCGSSSWPSRSLPPLPFCTANFTGWAKPPSRNCASKSTVPCFAAARFDFSADKKNNQTNADSKNGMQRARQQTHPGEATSVALSQCQGAGPSPVG